ncbi:PH domain-containing protein [Blastococcus capsensis]|uniref:PH domain-containing protein n=1 Tax=Blastococcus capsensis TaxID=1564163 RepID=UPI0025411CB8|nr:PH domain-containing protein [Blastococcus capsensis]MDK3257687.1 PH domain-containing protein [Blastococcus capsensis]
MSSPVRFRMPRSALVPVLVLALCILPTAAVTWWTLLLLLLLVPVLVAVWVLRRGADVGDEGITVRAVLGSRTVRWTELAGIRIGERGELWLVTTAATEVRLPVIRARDLPALAAASGGRLEIPARRTPSGTQ